MDKNEVFANITSFASGNIFAPLGEPGIALEVNISIKPTDDPNPINPNDRGVVPVAILNTTDTPRDFDPRTVNVSSLRFGDPDDVDTGDGATPAHAGHFEDVDGDGDLDLVIHFTTRDTGFDGEETEGKLVGELIDGTPIFGFDSVMIVGHAP